MENLIKEILNCQRCEICLEHTKQLEATEKCNKAKSGEKKLLKDMGEYLESKGWNPIIIGFKGIAKRKRKYNYSLIIDFTGKKNMEDKNEQSL